MRTPTHFLLYKCVHSVLAYTGIAHATSPQMVILILMVILIYYVQGLLLCLLVWQYQRLLSSSVTSTTTLCHSAGAVPDGQRAEENGP